MGMIADVIFNDVNGMPGAEQPLVASMYFHDDDPASVVYGVLQGPTKAAGSTVTFTESETVAGTYEVKLASTLGPDSATDDDSGETLANSYGNTMIEIMATDGGMLWTTQEFMVRRNRRPGILEASPAATNNFHPAATEAADTTAAVGTTNAQAMTELMAPDYFYDDEDDTIGLHEVSVDDDEVAEISLENGVLTVTGLKAGETEIRMKAIDSGMLVSTQHTVTLTVDAGPVASEKPLNDVTSSLSRTSDRIYSTPLTAVEYFDLKAINNSEGHVFTASSSDESIATVDVNGSANADADETEGDDPLAITLKALGTVTITLKVTEAESTPPTDDQPAPVQSVERTFVMTVID
jgi:hypothetical protein